jgi:hypothetical protein
MLLDDLLEFGDELSVATTATTVLIGDVIDLGAASRDIGEGEPLYLCMRTGATEIITAGSAGTMYIQLASDAQEALSTTTATIHLVTKTFVTDDAATNSDELNAGGTLLFAALPSGTYERYLGLLLTVGSTTVTAGTINAFLTKDPNGWKAYPDGL